MEHAQILQCVIALLSGFLFVVFLWWWAKYGRPTPIYKATCGLMFGIFLHSLGTVYIHYLYLHGENLSEEYTVLLILRNYFVLAPLIYYTIDVVKKLTKKPQNVYKNRRSKTNNGLLKRHDDP